MKAYRVTISHTAFTIIAKNAKDLFDRLAEMEEFESAVDGPSEYKLGLFTRYGHTMKIEPHGEVV